MRARVLARNLDEATEKATRYGMQWFQAPEEYVSVELMSADVHEVDNTYAGGKVVREDVTFVAEFHVRRGV